MVDRHPNSRQIVAVLFIALLAGGECARMSTEIGGATHSTELQELLERQSEHHAETGPMGMFWMHNDVCRIREMTSKDDSAAAHRYIQKYVKLQELTVHLHEEKCMKGCAASWIELKSRVMHFRSCSVIIEKSTGHAEEVPPTVSPLVEAMTSTHTSLQRLYANTLDTVSTAMKKNNMFPSGPKCSFSPHLMNITSAQEASQNAAEQRRMLRAQVFGQECDESAAQQYLSTLSDAAKLTASATMAVVDRMVNLAQHLQSAPPQNEAVMEKEGENTAKELREIVEDARQNDDKGDNKLIDTQVEEQIEAKQVSDDGGTSSDSTALVEVGSTDVWGEEGEYSWFEFWVGLFVIIVVQAVFGAFGGPYVETFQRAWYSQYR